LIAIPAVVISVIISLISSDTFLLIGSSPFLGSIQEKEFLSFPSTPYFVVLANLIVIIQSVLIISFWPGDAIKGIMILYLSNLQIPEILSVGAVYLAWILNMISVISYSLYYAN